MYSVFRTTSNIRLNLPFGPEPSFSPENRLRGSAVSVRSSQSGVTVSLTDL